MGSKICGLDIDGVLNDYPKCWINFINLKLGTKFEDLNSAKSHLSYSLYKSLKHEYRESGYKLFIKPRLDAAEFTRLLREMEYQVIIITSRPFDEYPNLRTLTRKWLDINGIQYDDIMQSSHKHADIILHYPDLEFMVEDNRDFANSISRLGHRVYLMENEYNIGMLMPDVVHVKSLTEILQILRREGSICL